MQKTGRALGIIVLIVMSLALQSCANSASVAKAEREFAQRNYHAAIQKLWRPAIMGNAQAQYALGYMHYYGLGTAKDVDMGRSWIRRSASKGYPPAVEALRQITKQNAPQNLPESKKELSEKRTPASVVAMPVAKSKPVKPPATRSNQQNYYRAPKNDMSWIRDQAPNKYTLQLATSINEATIRELKDNVEAPCRAVQFRYRKSGKVRNAVVCGTYSSFASAKNAKAEFPKNIAQNTHVYRWGQIQSKMLP